jgi:hypothetical protein
MRLAIDENLDALIECQGGFSTTLSYSDRLKLRAITRKVHLAHLPEHLQTDYECDKLIDIFGPATMAYLIRRTLEGG